MGSYNEKEPSGSLQISRNVIGSIAGVCAQEIEGVAGLARRPSSLRTGSLHKPGRPIGVTIKDNFVEINIGLALKYGAKIAETCTAVQQCVKSNVQTMTGMAVCKVNVWVAQVVFPSDIPEEAWLALQLCVNKAPLKVGAFCC